MMAAADVVTVPDAPPIAVYVAFFEHGTYHAGGGGAKSVWDTLAAAWDALTAVHLRRISPAFEHCNLVFEWRGHPNNLWLSFSTTIKNPSCFILTEYKDVNWRGVHLDRLSEDDRQRLFLWAMQNVGTPFDFCGYYWNFLLGPTYCDCCAVDADGNAFYCAEQVATALWFTMRGASSTRRDLWSKRWTPPARVTFSTGPLPMHYWLAGTLHVPWTSPTPWPRLLWLSSSELRLRPSDPPLPPSPVSSTAWRRWG